MLLFAEISSGRAFISRQPRISKEDSSAAGCSSGPCLHLAQDQGLLAPLAPQRGQFTHSAHMPCCPGASRLPGRGTERPHPTGTGEHLRCLELASIWAEEILFLFDTACFPQQFPETPCLGYSASKQQLCLTFPLFRKSHKVWAQESGHTIECLGFKSNLQSHCISPSCRAVTLLSH